MTQTPENFKGGDIWNVIVGVNGVMQGIGYGLLVLFFLTFIGSTLAVSAWNLLLYTVLWLIPELLITSMTAKR